MYKFPPINKAPLSLQKAYTRFLKIRGHPREIALGFALGVFVGMTPVMGLHTAIAVFFAALLKWNKISAAVGVWITNPLTAPFVYSFTYFVGSKLSGVAHSFNALDEQKVKSIFSMLQKTPEIFWALTMGGVIVGVPLALIGYYFSYSSVVKYQEEIKRKIAAKKQLRARKKKGKKKKKKIKI